MASSYLQVRVGPMLLMLEATGVHEVLGAGWRGDSREQAQWRGQVLPVISLARFFGFGDTAADAGVVYGLEGHASPLMFAADEVLGLCAVDVQQWKRLPALPDEVTRFLDAAFVRPGQEQLSYRLRAALQPSHFGVDVA